MEGFLSKYEGFFSGFVTYFFIQHDDTLIYMDQKKEKIIGSIHLKIAKIETYSKDPLLIQIFNGTNEIQLKASTIKEKVEWTNALHKAQKECLEGRYEQYKKNVKSPSKDKNNENRYSIQLI